MVSLREKKTQPQKNPKSRPQTHGFAGIYMCLAYMGSKYCYYLKNSYSFPLFRVDKGIIRMIG